MAEPMVWVSVNLDTEAYPVVSACRLDGRHIPVTWGVEVPESVMTAYEQACAALTEAEDALLRAAGKEREE